MVDPSFVGLAEMGFYSVIAVVFLIGVAQIALSAYAQRSLNSMHQQGLQAVVATNDIKLVDEQMEDESGNSNN